MVTLFPQLLEAFAAHGIPRIAVQQQALSLHALNPRDFTEDAHRTVDDRPYGGGPGMVMRVAPLCRAITAAREKLLQAEALDAAGADSESRMLTVYLSPQGHRYTQQMARQLAGSPAVASAPDVASAPNVASATADTEFIPGRENSLQGVTSLVLVAGRYEGIDERLVSTDIDCEWSVGDFVLSGGELAAFLVIDSICRLLPGVLGNSESAESDSFGEDGLLDYPHYTRPQELEGRSVPDVLLSGDHSAIAEWRRRQALQRTMQRRPDLLKVAVANQMLSKQDLAMLRELGFETGKN